MLVGDNSLRESGIMSEKSLLFVQALTGLHPGGGTALGMVDLPVQRERHTSWPLIPGSSLKGVLRAECNRLSTEGPDADPEVLAAFGPPTGSASEHAGAITISDARILAFPVRSLTGVFAWVTCPAVLDRLSRDLAILQAAGLPGYPRPERNAACCAPNSPICTDSQSLILEEFEFSNNGRDASTIADWLATWAIDHKATKEQLRQHVAVLHDDDFTYFVRNATEIVARIGLDYDLKTVRKGALFYEEYIPAETLFYSLVLCGRSRLDTHQATGREIMEWIESRQIRYLQIGGGETVGKGMCAVRFALPST